ASVLHRSCIGSCIGLASVLDWSCIGICIGLALVLDRLSVGFAMVCHRVCRFFCVGVLALVLLFLCVCLGAVLVAFCVAVVLVLLVYILNLRRLFIPLFHVYFLVSFSTFQFLLHCCLSCSSIVLAFDLHPFFNRSCIGLALVVASVLHR